jgi:hypothetical protein
MAEEVAVIAPDSEVVTTTEPQAPQEAPETPETPEPADTTGETAKKPDVGLPRSAQRRVDRAVRRQYEAEARANMLEERLSAVEQRTQPQATQRREGEPRIEDFQDFDQYVAAKAEWISEHKIQKVLAERDQRSNAERAEADSRTTADNWNRKLQKASADIPDLTEAIESSDVPMTPVMRSAIVESDVGPQLAYYLATHPDEAEDIAALGPLATVRALGRIEERLATRKPAKPSGAPAPITPSGQKAQASKDPANMEYDDFVKFRRAQIAKRR